MKTFKFNKSLSVIIPSYNEEGNLPKLIKDTNFYANKICEDFEIIIINDGSSDKTGKVAQNLANKYKNVRAVSHKKNMGLATAWKTGIKNARKETILYIEGDGQQPFSDQVDLLKKIEKADIVLGVRTNRFDYTPLRKLFSWGYLAMIYLLFGLKYKDVGWSQAYRKEIFKKIKINSVTPFFDTEIVIKALKNNFKVVEAKSYYKPRKAGKTSLGNFKTAYSMFSEALKMRLGLLD